MDNMTILHYSKLHDKEHWLEEIGKSDWEAGEYLYAILRSGDFSGFCGEDSDLLLLTEGDKIVSYCTLAAKDNIQPTDLTPWIGFVYTYPEYRGRHLAGKLIAFAEKEAAEKGAKETHISTDNIGLYEKYGYTLLEETTDVGGEYARIYVKKL